MAAYLHIAIYLHIIIVILLLLLLLLWQFQICSCCSLLDCDTIQTGKWFLTVGVAAYGHRSRPSALKMWAVHLPTMLHTIRTLCCHNPETPWYELLMSRKPQVSWKDNRCWVAVYLPLMRSEFVPYNHPNLWTYYTGTYLVSVWRNYH